jgi:hypothetical protein
MNSTQHHRYRGKNLTLGLLLAGMLPLAAWANSDDITEIRDGADELRRTLEAMPYAPQGEGAVIYTFEFSTCPYAQKFHSEWGDRLSGLQMRRFFYAVSQRSANETAALAASRDVGDYRAFMEGRKTAPRVDDPNLSVAEFNRNNDLLNSVMKPVTEVIAPILRRNGAIVRNFVSPMLIWEEDGRFYVSGGYTHEHMEEILQRVRSRDAEGVVEESGDAMAAATEAAGSSPAQEEHALSILGLTPGMTPEEVESVMTNVKWVLSDESRYVFSGTEIDFLAGQSWSPKEGRGLIKIEYTRPPDEPVAVAITRNFGIGDSILEDDLRNAIQAQYGEPDFSNRGTTGAALAWYRGADKERCASRGPGDVVRALQGHPMAGSESVGCTGTLLQMSLNLRPGANGTLASVWQTSLYDHGTRAENGTRFNEYGAELARQAEQERMKGISAPEF